MAVELNRENYENEVARSKEPVLVDFWGPQCRPCLALMPTMEKLEKEYAAKLKFTKLNSAENRLLCAKLRVMSLPTFLIYKNGKEIKRIVGEQTKESDLRKAIDEALI